MSSHVQKVARYQRVLATENKHSHEIPDKRRTPSSKTRQRWDNGGGGGVEDDGMFSGPAGLPRNASASASAGATAGAEPSRVKRSSGRRRPLSSRWWMADARREVRRQPEERARSPGVTPHQAKPRASTTGSNDTKPTLSDADAFLTVVLTVLNLNLNLNRSPWCLTCKQACLWEYVSTPPVSTMPRQRIRFDERTT
ncbi:unnamed protein product [Soboliphyme baturini]|uniref:Uncharacterized protein n=1 Tax=Soboliphyme baturini TaxID=241478 RepID=A0A183ISW8_9BILA|nr:unnamed protein product [Soboliphyme baturini]